MIEPRATITEQIAERIRTLRVGGMAQFDIGVEVDVSQSVVSVVLANLAMNPSFYVGREASARSEADMHAAHLRCIARGGCGFPVVTEPLLSRLYALEYAPASQMARYGAAA